MRNFYNLPKNKILTKAYGKGVHQFQADPMIDLTKCKCCTGSCNEIDCKGCMWGVTMAPNAGCCPSKNESLIFEYTRPGAVYTSDCCQPDFGGYKYQCCTTVRHEAENVRYTYHYVGKFFRIDYAATGNIWRNGNVGAWPENNLPRLCSWCDPSSNRANGYCDCMDFEPPWSEDDRESDSPCHIGYQGGGCIAAFQDCLCMGEGLLRNKLRGTQRLSHYRRKQMEREPYYRWLLDTMCYDKGNILKNPWLTADENGPQIRQSDGTLYHHLVGVVHCEHWWEIDRCEENPNVDFAAEGFTNINTSCYVPRFWIQACSGVPLFDWEFLDAVDEGYLESGDLNQIWTSMGLGQTPPQDIMNRMSQGGYFQTADWRQPALNEIAELKTRTYTKNAYANVDVPLCSDFKYLGPVRKRFFRDNIFEPGQFGYQFNIPAFLDPRKARKNIVNRNPNPVEAESLQLPDAYLPDPWNGNYPTIPAGGWPPGTPPEQIEEYEDFIAWRNAQWVYFHARPGGWDYVCAGYYNDDATVKIPDLPRRYMNDSITCTDPEESSSALQTTFGGCLSGILGIPQHADVSDCGGSPPPSCPNAIDMGCGAFSCFDIECVPLDKCTAYREQGGGAPGCGAVMVESNCEGMVFAYSRQAPIACPFSNNPDAEFYWRTTRTTKAWLYKVNIAAGDYGNFCPHYCRILTTPKPISTEFKNIFKKKPAHKYLCNNYFNNDPVTNCPGIQIPKGKYCFYSGDCLNYASDGEVCSEYHDICSAQWCNPGDGSGAPYDWGSESGCCDKVPGPVLPPDPIPVDYTHPAFTNINCDNCGPGTIYQTAGNYCATSKGCCYNCCEPLAGPTFISQSECYQGIDDPDDPLKAHILWVPSVNGVDCGMNPSPCNPPYPACPNGDPLGYCCNGTNCSGPIPQSQCSGNFYSTQIECENNCSTSDPLGYCCSGGNCSTSTQSQCSGSWYSTQNECLTQCSTGGGGKGYCCLFGLCSGPNFPEADCVDNGFNFYQTAQECNQNCV